jgi:hypothetical protein
MPLIIVNKKNIFRFSLSLLMALSLFSCIHSNVQSDKVIPSDADLIRPYIPKINKLFAENNISKGHVELDSHGRVQLKGQYEDENQVDLAFSLAQTQVGIKWVSPVTPENIKVKGWEKRFSNLFKRVPIIDKSIPSDIIKNKYALIVGIGKFKNLPTKKYLQYAVQDATDFYHFLTDPQRGAFPKNNVALLTDEQATRNNIIRELDKIREKATAHDLVCVYISSHGTPPNYAGRVLIVTYDTVVEPRHISWQTSIPSEILEKFIQEIPARRLIMIMDACYSNGAYKDIPGFLPSGGKSLGLGDEDEFYGISKDYGKKLLGAKDIVIEEEIKPVIQDKSLEAEPEGYGKVLISASNYNEKSWESETISNGYFTYFFVDGLERYNGSVQKAFYHAKPLVTQRVREEKQHEQNPQVMATERNWNINIKEK